jgi:two-component system response regulator MprA
MASETGELTSRILIVDDERSIVDTLSAVLDIRGFEVHEAYDGVACLKMLKEGLKPDLIVLDVLMPGLSGLDVCKQLKGDPQWENILVMLITVITKDSDIADGFWKIGTDADDFVTKPFDPFELADRIERLLSRRKGERTPTQ